MARNTVRVPDWLKKRKWLLISIGVAVGVGLAVVSHYVPWPEGFGLEGKTLWDWLSLLGVPLSLALLGIWFQQQEKRREAATAKEEVLQVYFDRISTLLVEKNLRAIAAQVYSKGIKDFETQLQEPATAKERELLNASMDVIRARTLSILRRFDKDGRLKGIVIEFLIEAEIINKLNLSLRGADLSDANLRGADLSGVTLHKANVSEANLSGAYLSGADLAMANLRRANLNRADLSLSYMSIANLLDANLSGVNLSGANLSGANLSGADLSGADLSGADLSDADLSTIKFDEKTAWPDPTEVAKARNIQEELMKQLGISTGEA